MTVKPRYAVLAACTGGLIAISPPAQATENGTQHYPIGVGTVNDGNLPPPGMLQWLNYTSATFDSSTTNGAGAREPVDFHLSVQAEAIRLMYTWKIPIGPLHYTTGLVQPLVNLDLRVAGVRGHDFGPGDLDIQNFLGYTAADGKIAASFGVDTFIPTGHYNGAALINSGNNFYTFAPNFNISYKPSPKFGISATLFSEFNTINRYNHYYSGNDFDFDYGMTLRPFKPLPKLGIGLQGYFYQQLGHDRQSGILVQPDGNRGSAYAIGPQLRYDIPFGAFILKYQHEFDVENRPSGQKIWFQFALPLR